jgi:hypothetical protein
MANKEISPKSLISDSFSNIINNKSQLLINTDSDSNYSINSSSFKQKYHCVIDICYAFLWCIFLIFFLILLLLFPLSEIIIGSSFFEINSCDIFINIPKLLIIKGCVCLLTSYLSLIKIYEKHKLIEKSIVADKYSFMFILTEIAVIIFESILFWKLCDAQKFNTILYYTTWISIILGIICLFLKLFCIFSGKYKQNVSDDHYVYF